ncbi:MAG TPA: orotate phosphoribosyltransferase [Clostridiaceae bacterium]|nr:orotate phosphoribosyltransferase [Clostridiaceae bacterium]
MNRDLIGYLFKTNAIRVCPKDKPFWYTSGKIGPYYVNTHFLYGSEEKANELLALIDRLKDDKMSCSEEFHRVTKENYMTDEVYRGTIDALTSYAVENFDIEKVDYVSGGERRDWFFSFMVADLLGKPHITLFKDLSAVICENGESKQAIDLEGANILHVADLITTASSYERAWVPAIQKINGNMKWSLVVVDRLQGGGEVLESLGVESHTLVSIDPGVFEKAREAGYIDDAQLRLVLDYMRDPETTMKEFLRANPGFLKQALSGDAKTAQRAMLLVQNNFYDVKSYIKDI